MTGAREQQTAGPRTAAPPSVIFANTVYAERGTLMDAVDTQAKLADWIGRYLPSPTAPASSTAPPTARPTAAPSPSSSSFAADHADHLEFLALRDAIRTLIGGVVDEAPADGEALGVLNRCAARLPAWPELVPGPAGGDLRLHLRNPAVRPAEAALGTLARDAADLLAGADSALLRACRAPGCVQFFVKDHPRRNWCSPACGNRARVAKHYARTRATA